MNDKQFDEILKKKLEQYNAPRPDNAWDAFKQDLDYSQSTDATFDDQFRMALSQFDTGNSDASWELMQEKMAEDKMLDDVFFDESVKEKLAEYEAPSSDSNWDKFYTLFQKEEALRLKLFRTKVIEACLIFLAIFTIWNMQPQIKNGIEKIETALQGRDYHHSIDTKESQEQIVTLESTDEKLDQTKDITQQNETAINQIASAAIIESNATNVQQENGRNQSVPKTASSTFLNESFTSQEELESFSSQASSIPNESLNGTSTERSLEEIKNSDRATRFTPLLSTPLLNNPISEESDIQTIQIPNLLEEKENNSHAVTSTINLDKYKLHSDFRNTEEHTINKNNNGLAEAGFGNLVKLDPNKIMPLHFSRENGEFGIPKPWIKEKKSKSIYVGTQTAIDFNGVRTPFDLDYNTNAYQHLAVGYSAGINVSFEKGRWSLESGLMYSSKSYSPAVVEEIIGSVKDGFNRLSLKDIEIQIVSIPVMGKYKIVHMKNWRIYGLIGGSINGAILANYFTQNSQFGAVTPEPNQGLTFSRKPILNEKEFPNGLLEGGDLLENIYFTANTGINFERKLSNKLSIYLQPSFAYNLLNKGLGPNNDRIHTFSLAVGTKVRIQ